MSGPDISVCNRLLRECYDIVQLYSLKDDGSTTGRKTDNKECRLYEALRTWLWET